MRVLFEAGHGGRDRANRGPTGYVEADGTLAIVLAARDALLPTGIDIVLTRDADSDMVPAGVPYSQIADLNGRTNFVNAQKPDLYVCVHTNALGAAGTSQTAARGTETYVQQASAVSIAAGMAIHAAVVYALGVPDRGVRTRDYDDGRIYPLGKDPDVDTDYYHVLRESHYPAVLIEVDFHDNPDGERMLLDPEGVRRAGQAIASGIVTWATTAGLITQTTPFSDVPADDFTASYIAEASRLGIITGRDDGAFGFGETLTKEWAVVLSIRTYHAALAAAQRLVNKPK